MIRVSWGFLTRRQKAIYIGLIAFRLAINVLDLAAIAAIGLVIMAVARGKIDFPIGDFYRIQFDETPIEMIVGLVLFAAFAFLIKGLASLGLALLNLRLMIGIEVEKSKQVLSYLLTGTLGEMRKYSRGDISFAANGSTGAMFSGLLGSVSSMISEFALMLMIVGAFFLLEPRVALAITIYIFILIVIIQWIIGERLKRIGQRVMKGSIASTTAVLDSVTTFREMSVLKKQDFFVKRFGAARYVLAKTKASELILRSVPRIFVEQSLMLGVLAFVGWQILDGNLGSNLAIIGVFIAGGVRLTGAILPIQSSYASLKSTYIKAEMAADILQKDEARKVSRQAAVDELEESSIGPVTSLPSRKSTEAEKGLSIKLDEVWFRYPDGDDWVVRGVSFEAKAGEFIAFVGPSGAGKTTLADIILGLHPPTRGSALIDGRSPLDVRTKTPGLISYVPQTPGMVAGSILENIGLGLNLKDIDRDHATHCLTLAGLGPVIEHLPKGIDTFIGKQSDALSGGQMQRLGLARALYPRPRLIVLDEATSALDAGTEAEVARNILNLGEEVTVLVIAHRLSTIQHADCVYAIDGGKIVGQGPFKQVRKQVPMIEEYVKLMSFED